MRKCDHCGTENRILIVLGKTADLCSASYQDTDAQGYVPCIPNIGEHGYGDYIEIAVCMECGKVQGNFPVSNERIHEEIRKM